MGFLDAFYLRQSLDGIYFEPTFSFSPPNQFTLRSVTNLNKSLYESETFSDFLVFNVCSTKEPQVVFTKMSCGHEHPDGICDHSDADRGSEFLLNSQIDLKGIRCLNAEDDSKASKVFKNWDDRFSLTDILVSDSDEELIIFIPFVSSLKLKSISIMGLNDSTAPSKMKVFINCDDVDFDSVNSMTSTQEWDLVQFLARNMVPEYPTKLTKFTNVYNLTIYIPSNFGEDVTKIAYIGLKGEFQTLNKDPIITIYEAAANPTDHQKLHGDIAQGSGMIQ